METGTALFKTARDGKVCPGFVFALSLPDTKYVVDVSCLMNEYRVVFTGRAAYAPSIPEKWRKKS